MSSEGSMPLWPATRLSIGVECVVGVNLHYRSRSSAPACDFSQWLVGLTAVCVALALVTLLAMIPFSGKRSSLLVTTTWS